MAGALEVCDRAAGRGDQRGGREQPDPGNRQQRRAGRGLPRRGSELRLKLNNAGIDPHSSTSQWQESCATAAGSHCARIGEHGARHPAPCWTLRAGRDHRSRTRGRNRAAR